MKKLTRSLKQLSALFLSFTLCTGITACQKTPDDALVAQKNQERLAAAAAETASEENSLKTLKETTPDTYTFRYSDNGLTITSEAPITLPDSDTLPAYKISAGYVSQELVTDIYNALFQGEKTYTFTGESFTKADCEAEILSLKQTLAKTENDNTMTDEQKEALVEELQSSIQELQEMYSDLPETSTQKKVEVDSTLQKKENTNTVNPSYSVSGETDSGSTFSVSSNSTADGGSLILYNRQASKVHYSSGGDEIPVTEEEARSELADSIGITYDEAQNLADDFFQAIGVDVKLTQTFLKYGYTITGDNSDPYYDESTLQDEKEYSAFHFYFARVFDDVVNMTVIDSMFSGTQQEQDAYEEAYSAGWSYETIELLITKDGIEKFRWDSPVSIDEKMSEDVNLLSFADASSIFEKMMPTIYLGRLESANNNDSNRQYEYNVDVTSINLCLVRVRNTGSESSGLLVPAWVFYGDWRRKLTTEEGEGEQIMQSPYTLIAINALDGTVIDFVKGY